MAALLFAFNDEGKSFAGLFKDSHFGKTYRDVRQIIIKKVPHRIKQFTDREPAKVSHFPLTNHPLQCIIVS
jgi:hypothetical protein